MQVSQRQVTRDQWHDEDYRPIGVPPFLCPVDAEYLHQHRIPSVLVLMLRGGVSLDAGILDELARSAVRSGEQAIVLEMSGVTVCDEAGLGEIIRAYITVVRAGGHLTPVNVSESFRRMVESMKFL